MGMQVDEDTDRDRYMSPLEAKQYGIIDHVIGGDEAGFKARLSLSLCRAAACCPSMLRGVGQGRTFLCLHLQILSQACSKICSALEAANPTAGRGQEQEMQALFAVSGHGWVSV